MEPGRRSAFLGEVWVNEGASGANVRYPLVVHGCGGPLWIVESTLGLPVPTGLLTVTDVPTPNGIRTRPSVGWAALAPQERDATKTCNPPARAVAAGAVQQRPMRSSIPCIPSLGIGEPRPLRLAEPGDIALHRPFTAKDRLPVVGEVSVLHSDQQGSLLHVRAPRGWCPFRARRSDLTAVALVKGRGNPTAAVPRGRVGTEVPARLCYTPACHDRSCFRAARPQPLPDLPAVGTPPPLARRGHLGVGLGWLLPTARLLTT